MTSEKDKTKRVYLCDRVVEYILTRDVDTLGALTIDMLAESYDISAAELIKTFALYQRIPLDRFIIRERIHRAVFMLEKDHSVEVEELSRRLGFAKPRDFIMEFKNYLAVHPNKYVQVRSNKESHG